jgi:TPR repeat protein
MYEDGEGVPQDGRQAIHWYTRAAESGDMVAQFNLASAYERGLGGMPPDLKQAVEWYRKAAKQGYVNAQYNLAVLYERGEKVQQNHNEAFKWFKAAAEQGDAAAQFGLGVMYAQGHGTARDNKEALKWYLKAAQQGNVDAQYNLALLYEGVEGVPRNYDEALRWYKTAAEQGDGAAQYSVGLFYDQGMGLKRDPAEAIKWYEMAARRGFTPAAQKLANKYETGDGVEQSEEKAKEWTLFAARAGSRGALTELILTNGQQLTPAQEQELINTLASTQEVPPVLVSPSNAQERADEVKNKGVNAPDRLILTYRCQQCGLFSSATADINAVPYSNMAEMIRAALAISLQPTQDPPFCPQCEVAMQAYSLDYHAFHSTLGKDFVVDCSLERQPGQNLQYCLLWWDAQSGFLGMGTLSEAEVAQFRADANQRAQALAGS